LCQRVGRHWRGSDRSTAKERAGQNGSYREQACGVQRAASESSWPRAGGSEMDLQARRASSDQPVAVNGDARLHGSPVATFSNAANQGMRL
ncbi:hypothetical protein BC831DRAFT_480418, partial [Entophlyctis helioformis]